MPYRSWTCAEQRGADTGPARWMFRSGHVSARPATRADTRHMIETTALFRRRHKLLLAALAASALSFGAAGMAWAADEPPPSAPPADADEEVDGVDCVDGIDAATGAECDGGPAANPTDEGPEDN